MLYESLCLDAGWLTICFGLAKGWWWGCNVASVWKCEIFGLYLQRCSLTLKIYVAIFLLLIMISPPLFLCQNSYDAILLRHCLGHIDDVLRRCLFARTMKGPSSGILTKRCIASGTSELAQF